MWYVYTCIISDTDQNIIKNKNCSYCEYKIMVIYVTIVHSTKIALLSYINCFVNFANVAGGVLM